MENILNEVIINNEIIGLSIVLVVLGKALKESPGIPNYLILWILIIISLILSLISSFSVASIIEGFIAVSLANTYHQTYKQTKEMVNDIRRHRT
ncbi:MAG: phage holin family protein [Bacilli bacterium]|nr:phage holin family protein [Bacilli bacterium]